MQRLIGSMLIVAGTSIGAGMLALPLAIAPVGLAWGFLLLLVMWGVMYMAALLVLKINTQARSHHSIALLVGESFGPGGRIVLMAVLGVLFYALLSAYTVGGASLIRTVLPISLRPYSAYIFLGSLAVPIVLKLGWVDAVNRVLFICMLVTFGWMLALLFSEFRFSGLVWSCPVPSTALWSAMPIVFTSFGFHGSIPSLIKYCKGDVRTLERAFLWGSLLPLVVYAVWILVALGHSGATQDVASLVHSLTSGKDQSVLAGLVGMFSFLAIATSFLGVGLGLFDLLTESLRRLPQPAIRPAAAGLTFVVPLIFTLTQADGFLVALRYAGASLSILALVAPALVAWKRGGHNRLLISALFAFGLLIVWLGKFSG